MKKFALSLLLTGALAFALQPVWAGPGHDHGPVAAASTTEAVDPRFSATTELFEVVGVLSAKEKSLIVFVDRFTSNEPVTKASVEIEAGAFKANGVLQAETGAFTFAADAFKKPGRYPIVLTITAGDDIDLISANLVVPEALDAHAHAHDEGAWFSTKNIVIASTALLLLCGLVFFVLRQRQRRRGLVLGVNHV